MEEKIAEFGVGDTIRVVTKILEQDKVRLHPFEGIVIAKKGKKGSERFTVRRVSHGEGIEKVFLINSPSIESIEIIKKGKVRRAKLYYLRKKIGKKAKI